MNHTERQRLARMIESMRAQGGVANLIAESKVDAVISGLAHELPDNFTATEVEARLRAEIAAWPSVKAPAVGSAEEAAIKAAARAKAGPTREDFAAMSPEKRLEAINAKTLAESEARAAQNAKLQGDHDHTALQNMKPGQRLELANSWKPVGGLDDKPKEPTAEERKKWDANRRLNWANGQQLDEVRAKKVKP